MPLPKSIQEKIAQPKPAQTKVDNREDEEGDAPEPQRKKDRPWSGAINGRAGLDPDVCAECWKNGHVCKPHCTVNGERLCIDCADGKPCAHVRAKEKDPKPAVHERYRVMVPAARQTRKHRAADVALVTNDAGSIVGVKRTPPPAAVAAPSVRPVVYTNHRRPQPIVLPASRKPLRSPKRLCKFQQQGKTCRKRRRGQL
jgi:hypothetical protein